MFACLEQAVAGNLASHAEYASMKEQITDHVANQRVCVLIQGFSL